MKIKNTKISVFVRKNGFKLILSALILILGTFLYRQYFEKIQNSCSEKSYIYSRPDNRPDEINGEIVTLKRLQPSYFKDYFDMVSDPKVIEPLYLPKAYVQVKKHLERSLEKESKGLTFLYTIFDNKDKKLIGALAIREPDPKDPGQFYCWLNSKYWGGGRISEAIKLLTNEYFKIKNVEKFNAHVEMWNLQSFFALKKNGFKLIKTITPKYQKPRFVLEFYNPNIKNELQE